VPDQPAQGSAYDGDDQPREHGACNTGQPNSEAQVPGQGLGHLGHQLRQVARSDPGVFWPDDAVDEANSERQPVPVAQHVGQSRSLAVCGNLGGRHQPGLYECNGLVGQRRFSGCCSGAGLRRRRQHRSSPPLRRGLLDQSGRRSGSAASGRPCPLPPAGRSATPRSPRSQSRPSPRR
jgi:hypothetical protein